MAQLREGEVRNGSRVRVRATQEEVLVVTVNVSGGKVKTLDCVDVKGKARRLRSTEVEVVS